MRARAINDDKFWILMNKEDKLRKLTCYGLASLKVNCLLRCFPPPPPPIVEST